MEQQTATHPKAEYLKRFLHPCTDWLSTSDQTLALTKAGDLWPGPARGWIERPTIICKELLQQVHIQTPVQVAMHWRPSDRNIMTDRSINYNATRMTVWEHQHQRFYCYKLSFYTDAFILLHCNMTTLLFWPWTPTPLLLRSDRNMNTDVFIATFRPQHDDFYCYIPTATWQLTATPCDQPQHIATTE
jgi:hypothetical protein